MHPSAVSTVKVKYHAIVMDANAHSICFIQGISHSICSASGKIRNLIKKNASKSREFGGVYNCDW